MAAQPVTVDLMTLLDTPGVGPSRVRKVLKSWRLVKGGTSLLDGGLLREALTESQVAALPESRERVKRHWDELRKRDIRALSILDSDYPVVLKRTLGEETPVLLLCLGNLQLLGQDSVGFCGSRDASEKGLAAAWDSAYLLAQKGLNIISGFAAGVDMNAHRAALKAGGTTTVVLAEGILRFRVKKEIRDDWDNARTLVISEFGPRLPWSVGHAMQRNRSICGLSSALILIEARTSGGSIEAGRDCLKLGLPLFAAVYNGMPEAAAGNEELLHQGARRLMKNRSTNLPNIRPVLEAIGHHPDPEDPTIR